MCMWSFYPSQKPQIIFRLRRAVSKMCMWPFEPSKKPQFFFRLRRAVSEMCVRPFETSKTPPMRIQFSLHDVRIINYNENLLKLLVNKKIIGLIASECPRARKFFKRKRVPPRENLDGAQV